MTWDGSWLRRSHWPTGPHHPRRPLTALIVGALAVPMAMLPGRSPVLTQSKIVTPVAAPTETLPMFAMQREYHERVVTVMLRLERARSRAQAVPAVSDPYLSSLQQERDRTALILLQRGDRLRQRFKDTGAAEVVYRQAVRLFPDSRAGAIAEQRLHELTQSKGDES